MTQKEKLFEKYVRLCNRYYELKGEIPFFHESKIGGETFCRLARQCTVRDLKDNIRYREEAISELEYSLKVKEYFSTEEGKARKAQLEELLEIQRNDRRNHILGTRKEIDEFIMGWLGKKWGVGCLDTMRVTFGLVESTDGEKNTLYFGYGFDVCFPSRYFNETEFSMSYGSTGSFQLMDENDLHPLFLKGLAEFTNNTVMLRQLRNKLVDYSDKLTDLNEKLSQTKGELERPIPRD